MKAARVLNGELGIHDVDAPTPGVDEALLRITASGVCHSDLHLARGRLVRHAAGRASGTRRSASSRRSARAPTGSWRSATA